MKRTAITLDVAPDEFDEIARRLGPAETGEQPTRLCISRNLGVVIRRAEPEAP